jgi:hypothetical protein
MSIAHVFSSIVTQKKMKIKKTFAAGSGTGMGTCSEAGIGSGIFSF